MHQTKNEEFFHKFEKRVVKGLLGSCYQALQDCALPETKSVNPTSKGITLFLGDHETGADEEAIEISARVHKVTSKAASVTLKKFIKRTAAKDRDGDATMNGEGARSSYGVVERETKYFVKPQPPPKEEKTGTQTQTQTQQEEEQAEEKPTIQVDPDDLVKGYKYGATWVLVEDEFEKLPTKMGIEVCSTKPSTTPAVLTETRRLSDSCTQEM